jgi:hypothetical protein
LPSAVTDVIKNSTRWHIVLHSQQLYLPRPSCDHSAPSAAASCISGVQSRSKVEAAALARLGAEATPEDDDALELASSSTSILWAFARPGGTIITTGSHDRKKIMLSILLMAYAGVQGLG